MSTKTGLAFRDCMLELDMVLHAVLRGTVSPDQALRVADHEIATLAAVLHDYFTRQLGTMP